MPLSDLTQEKQREFVRRLLLSRLRLLVNNGFYGLLLMHMKFGLTDQVEHSWTNGEAIELNPDFLDSINDDELDYVLMHEILHVVLHHCWRGKDFEPERFNIAADIVVNSNILKSYNMDPKSITLSANGGVQMHQAPNGTEGYEFTVEELYDLIELPPPTSTIKGPGSVPSAGGGGGDEGGSSSSDAEGGDEAGGGGGDEEEESVVSWEDGRAQRVGTKAHSVAKGGWDDHGHFGELEPDDELRDVWVRRFQDACESIEIREKSNGRSLMPAFAERLLKELRKPQTDWRTILNEFVQEEITDYSFTPPDRRFGDGPFFLPDFNEKEAIVKDVLFMVDTSGSMSDDAITAAFSEIKGALDQFNGKLAGWLGFFDAAIIEPQPFETVEEFRVIRPKGGGGTDFQIIFEYVAQHMADRLPASIIVLTDGFAPFPQEHLAMDIPVLWLLNNEDVQPPWGKVARIVV